MVARQTASPKGVTAAVSITTSVPVPTTILLQQFRFADQNLLTVDMTSHAAAIPREKFAQSTGECSPVFISESFRILKFFSDLDPYFSVLRLFKRRTTRPLVSGPRVGRRWG